MKKAEVIKNGNVNLERVVVESGKGVLNKANVLLDKRNTKLSTAIKLLLKHFPEDVLEDQMGEDYDKFKQLIK